MPTSILLLLLLWTTALSTTFALRRPDASMVHALSVLRGGVSSSSPSSSEYDSAASDAQHRMDDDDDEEEQWFDTYTTTSVADDGGGDDDGEEADDSFPELDSEEDSLKPAKVTDDATTVSSAEEKVDDNTAGYIDRLELADAYDGDEDVGNLDDSTDPGDSSSTAATAPAPPATTTPPPVTLPPAPTSIDATTQRVLQRELKYRPREIAAMRPDVAAVVVAKRLHRPTEGMPANWYRDPRNAQQQNQQALLRSMVKIVVPAAVGILAVTKGGDIVGLLADMLGSSSSSPEPVGLVEPSASLEDESLMATEPMEEEEDSMVFEQPSKKAPSNTKPGTNELDVTWLDKLITAVEYRIKCFLRWEI